jgi:hypothetical protein
MSAQIFELAHVGHVRIMGIADTEDDSVRVIYIEAPPALGLEDVKRGPGKLTGREAMALGHVLQELGAAMLGGDLRRDANRSER